MSAPSTPTTVLISGAGIAGPVLAYWLAAAGFRPTVIERAPSLRAEGQIIDIRGAGLEVVRRMGLDAAIRAAVTHEAGIALVDRRGTDRARLPVQQSGAHRAQSFTSEIEILRGDLSRLFYEKSLEAAGGVEYVFGDHVTAAEQTTAAAAAGGKKVRVEFASGAAAREFDLLVAADGQGSKVRGMLFPGPDEVDVRSLGQYTCYFTIPKGERDDAWSRWYNAPGGRLMLLRPDNAGGTRAYLSVVSDRPRGFERLGVQGQKELVRGLFADAGWEAERVLRGMDGAADFYMQQVVQVRMPAWHKSRAAVLGDTAYCPSPISGMGTTLAIVGAYTLAGELARAKRAADAADASASSGHDGDGSFDPEPAFRRWEELMRPYVAKAQSLPPGTPALANPQTEWGISLLNGVVGFVVNSGMAGLLMRVMGPAAEAFRVPDYEM